MTDLKIDRGFTKQNWRNFEILTGLLFELEFKLKKEQIVITQMAKDGGRDVQIEMSQYNKIIKAPKIEIWVEAKLRGKVNRVDIGDIAGSVIMASNSNINSVYFVTNCFFTPQTIQELLLFGYKSGLQIYLINGYHYKNLIEEHFETIISRTRSTKDSEATQENLIEFIKKLKMSLPAKADQKQETIEFAIEKGRIIPSSKYNALFKQEQKLELRKVACESISEARKVVSLSEIKIIPYIDDDEVAGNIAYQLVGSERKDLLEEIIKSLKRNETAILKGISGQGKTFFANHVMRRFYNDDYYILSTDASDHNIISFAKEVIGNLIGLDYFKLSEEDQIIIYSLSEYFGIDQIVGKKIMEILRKDKFTEFISPELCLEILVKLIETHNSRKKILLIVDNLHNASNDLIAFLKNVFMKLSKSHIPVLGLTTYQTNGESSHGNHWLPYLDSLMRGNKFTGFNLISLNDDDVDDFIRALLPGANNNLVSLVSTNTLKDPFFVTLYIYLLKQKNVIRSKDGKHWWIENAEILLDSAGLRSNQIDSLIKELLQSKLSDSSTRKIAPPYTFSITTWLLKRLKRLSVRSIPK